MASVGLAILRLTLATLLVAHGAHEVFGLFGDSGAGPGGLTATALRLDAIGLRPGFPIAVVAGGLQLIAGALVAVGLLTRWASIAVVCYFVFDAWKEHLRWGLFLNWTVDPSRGHGLEYSLLLIAAFSCLALTGAGALSVDGRRAQSAESRASARARLRSRV